MIKINYDLLHYLENKLANCAACFRQTQTAGVISEQRTPPVPEASPGPSPNPSILSPGPAWEGRRRAPLRKAWNLPEHSPVYLPLGNPQRAGRGSEKARTLQQRGPARDPRGCLRALPSGAGGPRGWGF